MGVDRSGQDGIAEAALIRTTPREAAEDESLSNEPVQTNLSSRLGTGRGSGFGDDSEVEGATVRCLNKEGGRSGAGNGSKDENQNAQKGGAGKAA
jgi:hypothetical protein